MQETKKTWVQSLDWEDPLEEVMATHSSILAWKIPWTEKPGRLWSIGSQRFWYKWGDSAYTHTCRMNWRVQDSFTHTWGALVWTAEKLSSAGPSTGAAQGGLRVLRLLTVSWGMEVVSQDIEAGPSRLLLTKPHKLRSVTSATFCWTTKAGPDSRGWVAKNLQPSLICSMPEPQSCFVEQAVGGTTSFILSSFPMSLPISSSCN